MLKIRKLLLFGLIFGPMPIFSQTSIDLPWCIEKAKANFPLIKKYDLIEATKNYSLENAAKGYLPQINLIGQGTYQSEVTKVPFSLPGMNIQGISKDQYRAYSEIFQPLNNKKPIQNRSAVIQQEAELEKSQLDLTIHQMQEKIQEIYFGILLIQEQIKLNSIAQEQIKNSIKKLEAAEKNGLGNQKNILELSAELLKLKQKSIDINGMQFGFFQMMAKLTGSAIPENAHWVRPPEFTNQSSIARLELKTFDASIHLLDHKKTVLNNQLRPTVGLFMQAGYGRPALNMLSNNFRGYYIGGLRINWSIGNFYTNKNDQKLLELKKQEIAIQRAQFLQNVEVQNENETVEINKIREMILLDDPIIQLKKQVKEVAEKELALGAIGANDYLDYLNAEELALENKAIHEIQLLNAIYKNKITKGL